MNDLSMNILGANSVNTNVMKCSHINNHYNFFMGLIVASNFECVFVILNLIQDPWINKSSIKLFMCRH